jgi:hypothetical protein
VRGLALVLLATFASATVVAASGETKTARQGAEAALAPPTGPGSVSGTVRYESRSPVRMKQLTNTVDVATCGATVQSRSLLLGPGGELGNVFVEVRRLSGGVPADGVLHARPSPLELRLVACGFEPHVAVVPTGASVLIANEDGVLHELSTFPARNAPVDRTVARYRRHVALGPEHFAVPEKVRLTCARHPWTSAYWVVTDNPFHAVTGPRGSFAIAGLPPDSYLVTAWHEDLDPLEERVDVPPGGVARLDLAFR